MVEEYTWDGCGSETSTRRVTVHVDAETRGVPGRVRYGPWTTRSLSGPWDVEARGTPESPPWPTCKWVTWVLRKGSRKEGPDLCRGVPPVLSSLAVPPQWSHRCADGLDSCRDPNGAAPVPPTHPRPLVPGGRRPVASRPSSRSRVPSMVSQGLPPPFPSRSGRGVLGTGARGARQTESLNRGAPEPETQRVQ